MTESEGLGAEYESAVTPEVGARKQTQNFTCRTAQQECCQWCISMRSDGRQWCCPDRLLDGDTAMKMIVSALVALTVLAGIAAPASAFDAKSLYGQLDRELGGGTN